MAIKYKMNMSGTTYSMNTGLNRSERREIKNKIKKIWNEYASETFEQDVDDICYIYEQKHESDLFPTKIELGDDYDSVINFLNKKLNKLRLNKLKRLIND